MRTWSLWLLIVCCGIATTYTVHLIIYAPIKRDLLDAQCIGIYTPTPTPTQPNYSLQPSTLHAIYIYFVSFTQSKRNEFDANTKYKIEKAKWNQNRWILCQQIGDIRFASLSVSILLTESIIFFSLVADSISFLLVLIFNLYISNLTLFCACHLPTLLTFLAKRNCFESVYIFTSLIDSFHLYNAHAMWEREWRK